MSETTPHLPPRAGNRRNPGKDPLPKRRKSTQPTPKQQEDTTPLPQQKSVTTNATPAGPPATSASKKPPRKGCGSKKPRYILTKALIKKALEEGYYELLEERASADSEAAIAPDTSSADHTDGDYRDKPVVISCQINADGEERLEYTSVGGGPEPPPKQMKTLEESLAEQKVRRLLEDMAKIKVVINIGALVKAAKEDPQLYQMLQDTKVPPPRDSSHKPSAARARPALHKSAPFKSSHGRGTPNKGKKGVFLPHSGKSGKTGGIKKFH